MSNDPITVKIDPMLAELAPKFLARCKQTVEEFRGVAQSGDLAAARRIGHALYGTASSFGFDEMAGIGKEIERAAKEGESEELKKLAERLDAHVARVRPVFD
ncbi:MAG TPA: Hpt domain-containing protein [Burkholderiales bacterium]|jgi:HPt (histidine-containing phosphotransfer) domain-containing protein